LKESSDGETLMAVSVWFQIWGAAEEKAQCSKSVFALGTCIPNLILMVTSLWTNDFVLRGLEQTL